MKNKQQNQQNNQQQPNNQQANNQQFQQQPNSQQFQANNLNNQFNQINQQSQQNQQEKLKQYQQQFQKMNDQQLQQCQKMLVDAGLTNQEIGIFITEITSKNHKENAQNMGIDLNNEAGKAIYNYLYMIANNKIANKYGGIMR